MRIPLLAVCDTPRIPQWVCHSDGSSHAINYVSGVTPVQKGAQLLFTYEKEKQKRDRHAAAGAGRLPGAGSVAMARWSAKHTEINHESM